MSIGCIGFTIQKCLKLQGTYPSLSFSSSISYAGLIPWLESSFRRWYRVISKPKNPSISLIITWERFGGGARRKLSLELSKSHGLNCQITQKEARQNSEAQNL